MVVGELVCVSLHTCSCFLLFFFEVLLFSSVILDYGVL